MWTRAVCAKFICTHSDSCRCARFWEIVVNGIIHRDYAIADDVQVKIFDNRIEVESREIFQAS